MADAPDFTFDPTTQPELDSLAPFITAAMKKSPVKPTVSLGAITTAEAQAWLTTQKQRYAQAVGQRSFLLRTMDILDRVDLVDAT